jgi:hypothetical protein
MSIFIVKVKGKMVKVYTSLLAAYNFVEANKQSPPPTDRFDINIEILAVPTEGTFDPHISNLTANLHMPDIKKGCVIVDYQWRRTK